MKPAPTKRWTNTSAPTSPRRSALEWLAQFFLVAGVVAMFAAFLSTVLLARRPAEIAAMAPAPIQTLLPTLVAFPTPTPTVTPTPLPPAVALLAGHSGGEDPGAICPDGLREVDVTTDVARRAQLLLEARGYRVDILAEHDARLSWTDRSYSPRVLLAIHADSCVYYASGFKAARAEYSAIAFEDDRLVHCVTAAYAQATQLPFHEGSITTDMTHYHAFYKFNPQSPGAIIELGFLGADKRILRDRRDLLALGIADGVDRFLRGEACR